MTPRKHADTLRSVVPQTVRERLYEWHPGRASRWRIAEAEKPMMLYSLGKDSSVMLDLAMRAEVDTHVMKTVPLRQAFDEYGFDAASGGARRDEERSRAI